MCKRVAIVVPVYKEYISSSEKTSLRHLTHYLPGFDTYFIAPENLKVDFCNFRIKYFSKEYFKDTRHYNRLLLTTDFYKNFDEYQYILIYQLDCLVFSNELLYWCDRGYDYIGPPWLKTSELPWVTEPAVGNGGFSLRNVESFLGVLKSKRFRYNPQEYWKGITAMHQGASRYVRFLKKMYLSIHRFNNISLHIRDYLQENQNEDRFFTLYAKYYNPAFKIASVKEALRFGFEADPELCFKMNGYKLPFGCHAWEKYKKSFWEPYILQ